MDPNSSHPHPVSAGRQSLQGSGSVRILTPGAPPALTQWRDPKQLGIFAALVLLGMAGNHFKFTILFNADLIFGTVFAVLALQLFGLAAGVLAALVISAPLYVLWGHPYAVLIMTAEVAAVGWLSSRRRVGFVQADALYWFLIGMPLVYLFYRGVMQVPVGNALFIMVKDTVNGLLNVLVARLLYTGISMASRKSVISYREAIYNTLALFVMGPALILVTMEARNDFKATERQIRASLFQVARQAAHTMETWVLNRQQVVVHLAGLAHTASLPQMQASLDQARASDPNFLRIGLMDRAAMTTAFSPQVDELGHSNIGKGFADRPFIPTLKQSLKPLLSEVVMAKLGAPRPMVAILAPRNEGGEYGGYVSGVLSLEQIREHLEQSLGSHAITFSLVDRNGDVILTNHKDREVMRPFARGKGSLLGLDDRVSQWVPALPPNTPAMERWGKSFYVSETQVGRLAEWKLILEQPIAPFQKELYSRLSRLLSTLLLLLAVSLVVADLVSRWATRSLEELGTLTQDLPRRLATTGPEIQWPTSSILETRDLVANFKTMSTSLHDQFAKVRQSHQSLEERVAERTADLRDSEARFRSLAETAPALIWMSDSQGVATFLNPRWEEWTGQDPEQALSGGWAACIHPEDRSACLETYAHHLEGRKPFTAEFRLRDASGEYRWVADRGAPRFGPGGEFLGFIGAGIDVTERKQAEEALRLSEQAMLRLNQDLELRVAAELARRLDRERALVHQSRLAAMGEMIGNIAHQWRQPLNALSMLLGGLKDARRYGELTDEVLADTLGQGHQLIQQMSSTITDFMDFSRPDKVPSRFPLASQAREALALVLPSLRHQHVSVEIEAVEELWALGHPNEFSQVILNLLGNARDAIQATGTHPGLIHIAFTRAGNQAQIRFSDNGGGIRTEPIERIFEPYFTDKPGGTGLGLYMSRMILEQSLRSTISVRNIPGGAEFLINLPLPEQD